MNNTEVTKSSLEAPKSPFGKARKLAAIGALATVVLTGCSDTPKDYGEKNPKVSSVSLDNGARIRNDPFVGSSPEFDSLIRTVDLNNLANSIDIPTPGGVYEQRDANGEWYGIPAADFPAGSEMKDDSDGIVWVNDAKARENESPNIATVATAAK
ncbi:MAG: hypothetical protein ABI716_02820 [Candidatus Saccharibacteria bacterium]